MATVLNNLPKPEGSNLAGDLVEALQSGDPRAFDEAYRKYHPVMLRVAQRYTSAAVAEDATQEAWLAALGAISSFEGRSSLKTWLCRIVANKALNTYRENRREFPATPSLELLSESSPEYRSFGPPTHLSEPEMAVQRSRVRDRIRLEMKTMNRDHANALLLKGMSPLTGSQVSDVLAISHGNLRVILHRARSELVALL
ncbi:RNA polymerase sigma factor [Marinobacter sp. F4206]|uniref:RNA polymerase sigma factor n=1 Tax=Marinobacter sp. F4206 TaxID=2861777 RepID=UPI001C5D2742|nr:RNA polymerase sigma factor [Marinobacter sp. F4206]MBW4933146.1 RNA polymerase sigma factor [Marinobacter sp. F4206]